MTDEIITNSLGTVGIASVPARETNSDRMPPKKAYKTLWEKIFGEQQAEEIQSQTWPESYAM